MSNPPPELPKQGSPQPPPFPAQALNYQTQNKYQPEPLDYSPVKRFFMGTLIGTGVSAAIWIGGQKMFSGTGDAALIVALSILGIKFVAFITCMFLRRWRTFGVGLLVSLALGFLIFFGVCTVNLNIH